MEGQSLREQFQLRFGQPIEAYATIQRAMETLKPSTKKNALITLPKFFLFLEQNPDEVIEQRKREILSVGEDAENYDRKVIAFAQKLW